MLAMIERRKLTKGTEKKLMGLYHHLEYFGRINYFGDLTKENVLLFDSYLSNKGLSKTSIYERHKQFKSFITEARLYGKIKNSPYEGLKFAKGKAAVRKYLNKDELAAVENKVIKSGHISQARDLFVFCCYTGLAYADMHKFDFNNVIKLDNNYYIEDVRTKTEEQYHILILPKAYSVLKKYKFKLPLNK